MSSSHQRCGLGTQPANVDLTADLQLRILSLRFPASVSVDTGDTLGFRDDPFLTSTSRL